MKYSITKYEDRYVLKINNVTFYDTDETIIQLIKFLPKQNKDLQQRIDKAIEYIKDYIPDVGFGTGITRNDLLKILQGKEMK